MSGWLDPVRSALDEAREPIDLFFRDDDAGWDDPRLLLLIDVFEERLIPLDLAVIPQALTRELAAALMDRRSRQPLGFHQHGFTHANHERAGRKCEFGPGRTREQQRRDIEQGRKRLAQELDGALDPTIFTPPWNRCTEAAVEALDALGFEILSRDLGAQPLPLRGLRELPVSVDWCRHAEDRGELGRRIAAAIERPGPTGVMLHHAVMPEDDLGELRAFLDLLRGHDRARCHSMAALAAGAPPREPSRCAK